MNKLKALSQIEIFRDLTPQEMEEIDRAITMSTCEPGRVFYAPEETGEVLFLLKSGRVQLYRLSPSGKKLVVAVLEPGAIFGEMSLVGQGMHNTFAEAIEPCTLCAMSRGDVERLILSKPKVGVRILEIMARRLSESETKLEELAFKSIPGRLASLLLKLSEKAGPGDLVQGYTHQDLAEMVGTYRETTTQTLNEFKNQGLIAIARKRITILDRRGLQAQAQN
ncbi:MAG: Crp/Fnr family transcriptional regulator [Anaerolineales bacterium]|jgi:CRP-like cAMP-binding protein